MKRIALTQEKYALVDDEDFERLNQFKWYAHKSCNTFYAERAIPGVNGKQNIIMMHHEIIGKSPKGFMNDHVDGNGLHNFKNNLRFVTRRQNGQNQQNRKDKSSQYPGIYWCKTYKKWIAQIKINGIKKHLGRFINELDAFNAYRQAVEAIGEEVLL